MSAPKQQTKRKPRKAAPAANPARAKRAPAPAVPGYADVKRGMTGLHLAAFLETGRVSRSDLELVIAPRTLNRRLKDDQPLPLKEADAVTRMMRVRAHAQAAFGTADRANMWLETENPELYGERPIEMAQTDVGAREVEKVLARFEHGIFS